MKKIYDLETIHNHLMCGIISVEDARVLVEENMRLTQIEKLYGAQIKQLPNNGRWWIRLDGKAIYKTTRQAVLQEIAKRKDKSNDLEFIAVAKKMVRHKAT